MSREENEKLAVEKLARTVVRSTPQCLYILRQCQEHGTCVLEEEWAINILACCYHLSQCIADIVDKQDFVVSADDTCIYVEGSRAAASMSGRPLKTRLQALMPLVIENQIEHYELLEALSQGGKQNVTVLHL